MTIHHYEIISSRRHEPVSVPGVTIAELSRLCDCSQSVARRLFASGLIEPLSAGRVQLFDRSTVVRVRKALRLKRDLRLNFDAMVLVMELLDRIDYLERRR